MNNPYNISRRRFLLAAAAAGWAVGGEPWKRRAAASQTDAGWLIGCYTRPFDQFELPVALDGIAEAGYKYAGIMTAKGKTWVAVTPSLPVDEARKIGEAVRQRGMKALSVYGDFSFKGSVEEGIRDLRKLIDHCAACGAPFLLLGGVSEEKLYDAYFKTVAECCDYAQAHGIVLTIKPHGGLNATGPQCRKAMERVGHKNFRLWYDPGNIYYYSDGKLDPVEDSATVDALVAGMSVKDFLPPKEVMVTPGTGKVNFAQVMARLKQGGFTHGPLIVECLAKGDLKQTIAEARKARKFLEQLVG